MSPPVLAAKPAPAEPPGEERPRAVLARRTSLFAHGEPMVWLMGAALVVSLLMIAGLLALVLYQGLTTFWPDPVVRFDTLEGAPVMGEVSESELYEISEEAIEVLPEATRERARRMAAEGDGWVGRRLVRTGNFDLTGTHFRWVSDFEIVRESRPPWAFVVERMDWGRFYGTPQEFRIDGQVVATGPEAVWDSFHHYHGASRARFRDIRELETYDVGRVNHRVESVRLELREVELEFGKRSPRWHEARRHYEDVKTETDGEFAHIRSKIDALKEENERFEIVLRTADDQEKAIVLAEVVRAHPPNSMGLWAKLAIYVSRWWEFLSDDPREANSEGGVFPAIFGTVVMTLLMSVVVVPFGVLAALYLREYARQGAIVSAVRIAVNNLAGVPSIVFGVFGLGFFCYIIGGGIDEVFYKAKLPSPTFGTGGIFWASLTLALLTLPVVIVATEEAISAVPSSMREGSYACGATKWQTIRRIVLPKAAPGIMTGMILAIARGAGEVAPLMLVGALKVAPELPVDGIAPFIHPERSFMHLGFHIYDLGFQSQNSEAAKPMVYTTTLLLIGIIVVLNVMAIWIRGRLRRKVQGGHI